MLVPAAFPMKIDRGAGLIQFHGHRSSFFNAARLDLLALDRKHFLPFRCREISGFIFPT